MDNKKRKSQDERRTLKKAQEVHYGAEFRAADRAAGMQRKS
ncbi:YfhE family protein [Halalkalibacter urbisdiaboli]|nr:YfhE family protein [Halalkalibacter urbisdiaboli]